MFYSRILLVGVLYGVLIGLISRNLSGDLLADDLPNPIGVFPFDVAEQIIEGFNNVAEPIQLRLRFTSTTTRWDGSDYGTKFTGDLNVTVKNEDGDILDTVTISPEKEGWIRTDLKIGDYHETIKAKELSDLGYKRSRLGYEFTVIVSDSQGELKDRTFRFEGAKVTINPHLDMFKVENEEYYTLYFVHELFYSLKNEGDLPAYPRSAKFKENTFDLSGTILGHKGKRFSHSLSMELHAGQYPPNLHYFSLYIFDNEGKRLAKTTWEVDLKYEKPSA